MHVVIFRVVTARGEKECITQQRRRGNNKLISAKRGKQGKEVLQEGQST